MDSNCTKETPSGDAGGASANEEKVAFLRHEILTPLNQIVLYTSLLNECLEDEPDTGSMREDLIEIRISTERLQEIMQAALQVGRIKLIGRLSLSAIDERILLAVGGEVTGDFEANFQDRKVSILRHQFATQISQLILHTEVLIAELKNPDPDLMRKDLSALGAVTNKIHTLMETALQADRMQILGDLHLPPIKPEIPVTAEDEGYDPESVEREALIRTGEIRSQATHSAMILIVDDEEKNRAILRRHLERHGYTIESVANGQQALDAINSQHYDLMLLDALMPEMDGFEVLKALKKQNKLLVLPVIMISGLTEIDSAARCIEIGAEDFLTKPFHPALLQARIESSLERKRFHDARRELLDALHTEQEQSERLLMNILPREIAEKLKGADYDGFEQIAQQHNDTSVMFFDLVGFTKLSKEICATELVGLLDGLFSEFDRLTEGYGLEKIKTIGDAYMVAGGVPKALPDHAPRLARLALDMRATLERFNAEGEHPLHCRIGLNAGSVVAGVIGSRKFTYDLWGDTVNLASRMESYAPMDQIQSTTAFHALIQDQFQCTKRESMEIRGMGVVDTYLIERWIPPAESTASH